MSSPRGKLRGNNKKKRNRRPNFEETGPSSPSGMSKRRDASLKKLIDSLKDLDEDPSLMQSAEVGNSRLEFTQNDNAGAQGAPASSLDEDAPGSGRAGPPSTDLSNKDQTIAGDSGDGGAATDGQLCGTTASIEPTNIETDGLTCILCHLDPSVDSATKAKIWVPSDIEEHIRGAYHCKANQLRRAARRQLDLRGCVLCHVCRKPFTAYSVHSFMQHLRVMHPDRLVEQCGCGRHEDVGSGNSHDVGYNNERDGMQDGEGGLINEQ